MSPEDDRVDDEVSNDGVGEVRSHPGLGRRLYHLSASIPGRIATWFHSVCTIILTLASPIPFAWYTDRLWIQLSENHDGALSIAMGVYVVLLWNAYALGEGIGIDAAFALMVKLFGLYVSVLVSVAATAVVLIGWFNWPFDSALVPMLIAGIVSFLTAYSVASASSESPLPIYQRRSDSNNVPTHIRGTKLVPAEEAAKNADLARSGSERGFLFGPTRLPLSSTNLGFLYIGATGSGKTLSLLMLMIDALRCIGRKGCNALVYDGKNELYPYLLSMDCADSVILMNAADARSVRWALWKDVRTEADARQLAAIFFPDEASVKADGSDPHREEFWRNSPRDVVVGVILSLIMRGCYWDLRDLLLILRSASRIAEVLSWTSQGRRRLEYFNGGQSGLDIISTIKSKVESVTTIAANWQHCTHEISLREWVRSSSVLVLGTDEETKVGTDALNKLIFSTAKTLLLAQRNSSRRQHWIFLDEARQAGSLDIRPFSLQGRSKGVRLAYTIQDRDGMIGLYRREGADEILGQFHHKTILSLTSPETAQWASNMFGVAEEFLPLQSTSEGTNYSLTYGTGTTTGHQGGSRSSNSSFSSGASGTEGVSQSFQTRPAVLPSEFGNIPVTNPVNGLKGFYKSPVTGPFSATLSGEFLAENLIEPAPSVEEFVRRDPRDGVLLEFTRRDRERLGLSPGSEDADSAISPEWLPPGDGPDRRQRF